MLNSTWRGAGIEQRTLIARRFKITHEQRKLLLSLVTNFATRIPGAAGLLWFLPLVRYGLGTNDYADLLSSLALGSAASFLSGGFCVIGRRLIGDAYSVNDRAGEADGFISVIVANIASFILSLVIILVYCWLRAAGPMVLVVSLLPAISLSLMTADNIRSAYNEQYVTALLQFGFQVTLYTIGFLVPATRHNLIMAALIIQSHYIIASLITLLLLLRDRPYLISGRPNSVWRVMREGTMLAMADGFTMATLSLSVVWLQVSTNAGTSAWFATIVRLFQTFLVPVILLLMPLSSYIRISWNGKSIAQQRTFVKATLGIGLGYGAFVAVGLFFASKLYVDGLLHLPSPEYVWQYLPIFLLFAAIVAYKSYSSIAYVVLNETIHLSSWTTVALTTAVTFGAVASLLVEPLNVVNVFALTAGLTMIAVLFWSVARAIQWRVT